MPDDPSTPEAEIPSHHGPQAGDEAVQADAGGPILSVLQQRASCRDFLEKPIPEEVLEQILQAGAHAASGGLSRRSAPSGTSGSPSRTR